MVSTKQRPRVLHFIQHWLPLSEAFVYDLVTKTRHPGIVVSSGSTENLQLFPYEPLRSLDRLPAPRRFRRQAVTARLMILARRHRVGVLHVHHGYRLHEVMGARRRLGLPLVLSLHGHDITGSLETHP